MNPRVSRLAVVLAAACLVACGGTTSHYDYSTEPDPTKLDFPIGVADALQITVWNHQELSTSAIVRPDGAITMSLIGDLRVAGRTTVQLAGEIKQELSKFVHDEAAVVTVSITAVNSYSFTVAGNVASPGLYKEQKYVTVAEAIAKAGGPNKYASPAGLVLIRKDRQTGKVRRIPIDYDDIRSDRRPEANLYVLPGDTVFLP